MKRTNFKNAEKKPWWYGMELEVKRENPKNVPVGTRLQIKAADKLGFTTKYKGIKTHMIWRYIQLVRKELP
jgi:hypothetical protein